MRASITDLQFPKVDIPPERPCTSRLRHLAAYAGACFMRTLSICNMQHEIVVEHKPTLLCNETGSWGAPTVPARPETCPA